MLPTPQVCLQRGFPPVAGVALGAMEHLLVRVRVEVTHQDRLLTKRAHADVALEGTGSAVHSLMDAQGGLAAEVLSAQFAAKRLDRVVGLAMGGQDHGQSEALGADGTGEGPVHRVCQHVPILLVPDDLSAHLANDIASMSAAAAGLLGLGRLVESLQLFEILLEHENLLHHFGPVQ